MKNTGRIFLLPLLFILASCSDQQEPQKNIQMQPAGPDQVYVTSEMTAGSPMEFEDMMTELMGSMEVWDDLAPAQKVQAVRAMMQVFQQTENAVIRQPPEFYVPRIEAMLQENPEFPHGLPAMLKVLAVMEYDFETGEDKDVLAREVLGERLYALNKQRFEQAQKAQ